MSEAPRPRRGLLPALLAASAAGLTAGAAADLWSPPPTAEVARGSEEAFTRDLHLRQFRESGPFRWTRPAAAFTFRRLPPGPARLEVRLRRHEGRVTISAGGRVLGAIEPGSEVARFPLGDLAREELVVRLDAAGFRSPDGRSVGAQLERVSVRHPAPSQPSFRVMLPFGALAAAAAAAAWLSGFGAAAAVAAGALAPGFAVLALRPCGLLRSAYADELLLLGFASLALATAFARACAIRWRGAAPWAAAALLAALLVQGAVATSPLLVTSDAPFHAHNLLRVSSGNLFLVSATLHAQPFEIPYGSLFYAALVPLHRLGLDPILLVRRGAAACGVLASAALFLGLARHSIPVAGLAVMVLQLLPITLEYFSTGSLATIAGQALVTGFFAWWAGGKPGGALLGGALLAAGGLAHLSSLIILTLLVASLALLGEGWPVGRARWILLALGFVPAALFYGHYLDIILGQLPRMLEGAGQGAGVGGAWRGLLAQARDVAAGWGLPAIALAAAGLPRRGTGGLDRALFAYWLTGAACCAIAALTPLEVRYVHALSVPVSLACARTLVALWERGVPARLAAGAGVALQAWVAARFVLEALLERNRP